MPLPVFLLAALLAQVPTTLPGGAEFPAADVQIWRAQQAGLLKKDAARQLADAPTSPRTFRVLMASERVDEALDCLMRIVDAQPERMAEALPALWTGGRLGDGTRDYSARLKTILALAHQRARTLPREQAAAAELQLLSADGLVDPAWRGRSPAREPAFVAAYAGTEAELKAQIADAVYQPFPARLAMLDRIALAHPRTGIAARALYEKAFQLGHNAPVSGPNVEWDPTERFLQAVAIARELESGAYPDSEDTRRAPSLVIDFFAYKPVYAPGNVDRMLAAYTDFVKRHFTPDPAVPLDNAIGYVISKKMRELFELEGDKDGVDRTLRDLERDGTDPDAARYLRALYAMRAPDARARARELLASLEKGTGRYAGTALATLAALDVEDRGYAAARDRYRTYVQLYPQSAYAWVAALRIGDMDGALDDWKTAASSFRAAARQFAANSLAAVLGHELAAQALEAQSDPQGALDEHAAALAAWDDDYGLDYPLVTSLPKPAGARVFVPTVAIRKPELASRVAQLRAMLRQPGGALLEHARWLLDEQQRDAAVAAARDLIARFPQSSLIPEGRRLMHRAQLEAALDLGNIERAGANPAAARTTLDALVKEPLDPVVSAAKIARASAMWTAGEADAAKAAMSAALREWGEQQTLTPPSTDLEREVAAIRDVVFRPLGGGIYDQARGWNAFKWPATQPAYLVVSPEVSVKLPSGDIANLSVSRPIPGVPNVLYADTGTLALLQSILVSLGGTKRRQPAAIMETPNQPAGASMKILELWNAFFPARPGHWGGWELTSYPQLTRIEFLDAAHLKAAANVTVGYSGCTIVLERRDGVWTAVRLTNQWIT